ncbi:MAG TPA: phosphate signaling complex protein PhoU [Xanthobacteraceae bacterium]|jgi:phosphate transport system protein
MADHTSTAFDEDLRELSSRLAEMGGLAERLLAESVRALVKRDTDLAQRVIASDVQIDLLLREIEEKAVLTIARRQPMAVDLREIVATLRISNDLERVGDLAKNTAKRVLALDGEYQAPRLLRGVEHMSEMVLAQLKEVLDAYGARDEKRAVAVWTRDGEVDAMYTSLFRELLTYMMEDPRHITLCTHLLFCAKNIERIGDHATNIAETVYYLVVGEPLTDERPKSDTTSFTTIAFPRRGEA